MTVDKSVDKKKSEKKRPGMVAVDLGELKEVWGAYCKRNNTTSSKAFKEVVKKLTGVGKGARHFEVQQESLPNKTNNKRMVIRWTESEFAAIQNQAEGHSSPSMWVVDTVRARLTETPQFGMREVEALWESSGQLMRIGTNLNQIARAINRNPLETDLARLELIEELRAEILSHTAKVAKLLNANLQRWDIK